MNRLLKAPALMTAGEIVFHDRDGHDIDIVGLDGEGLRAFRWDKISMVFQGAMNSLNPVISVKAQIFDIFDTQPPRYGQEGEDRTGGRACSPWSASTRTA